MRIRLFIAAFLAFGWFGAVGANQALSAPDRWAETKCERYKAAWQKLMARRGPTGLGDDFMRRHDAFMASGCTSEPNVCPVSATELDVANIMVIAAMNAGTASTFPPFRCTR